MSKEAKRIKRIEKVIDSLFDDYLEEFRTEHPIDNSFLATYKDYKSIFVKEAAESPMRI